MRQSAFKQVTDKFFKTTTLHGFKYLISRYYLDGILWVWCCVASACCAGVLCAVLWARFLQVPALLSLQDLAADSQEIPTVTVCQPPDVVALTFLSRVNTNGKNTTQLASIFANALQGKPAEESQLIYLENLLVANNMSLLEVLYANTPQCHLLTRQCRWQNTLVTCDQIFKKELTQWGVCCVANPDRLLNISVPALFSIDKRRKLEMALKCSNGSSFNGCEFVTKYKGEEWLSLVRLSPGFTYFAHLSFIMEKDNHAEKLVDGTCISSDLYSRKRCLLKCVESKCGCSDPLRSFDRYEKKTLPPCPLRRLSCLRTHGLTATRSDNSTCNCLPSCKKIITRLILDSSPLINLELSLNPLYKQLNANESTVLHLEVDNGHSKIFSTRPTETWLTLLSSLGGVFNMFLGVGLFSALEFLFFLFVRLPIAIRRSTEMITPTVTLN